MTVTDVGDSNFEDEVVKSKIPVVVDIWAPWCVSTDSIVLIDKRKTERASAINREDKLLAYDGKKITRTKVLNSKTTSKGGHCKEIITENDRVLKVTDDHLIYTPNGWQRADELKKGDKVAIYPIFDAKVPNNEKVLNNVLIGEEDLIKVAEAKMRKDYLNQIATLNLIPLKYDNPKMKIIARLTGALFSDGSLYRRSKNNVCNVEFFLGQKEDVEELSADLKELGFKFETRRRVNKFKISNRNIVIKTYRIRVSSTALWLFMKALGVPNGRKTDAEYELPNWLLNAPNAVKREFLSAYLGGDGPSVSIKVISRGNRGSYNSLNINDIEFYKLETLVDNGINFGKQIAKLLEEQGVSIKTIYADEERYPRKYGGSSRSIHISLSSSFDSGYALASIGYAYAWQKQIKANYVGEFLGKKLKERRIWMEKYDTASNLFKQNVKIKEIALKVGIKEETAYGWLKHGNRPTINMTHDRYNNWLKDATKNLDGGFVWENIQVIGETYLPKVQVLTIEKYSNFIANGFLVHNCGPCRLYGPIVEEVSKDYEGKVKFVKVNADENEKTMAKFNVSSIPTTLFIQNGQLKAMNVGAVPKETLRKWISQNM